MSDRKLDTKPMILLGLALVGGLFGARSMLSSTEPPTSTGFGGAEPLPLGAEIDLPPPLDFNTPIVPRNPFLDERTTVAGSANVDSAPTDDAPGDDAPGDTAAEDDSFEG